MTGAPALSRRGLLASGGALVVAFSLRAPAATLAQEAQSAGHGDGKLPGNLGAAPRLDSWIRVDASGKVTVLTGKAELGQGIKTALIQVAAEELDVEPRRIELVTADTGATPDEDYTAGSQSMSGTGTAIRHAAAQVRGLLIGWAAERLAVPPDQLRTRDGVVLAADGRSLRYGELVEGRSLRVDAAPTSPLKDPAGYGLIGKSLPRVDIPAKVTGAPAYVQDLRLPGMVHARVVRPPSYGARMRLPLDTAPIERMPGVLKVVRDGSHLAVVAEREYQAIEAMRALASLAAWDERPTLPDPAQPYQPTLKSLRAQERLILDRPPVPGAPAPARTLEATYTRPFQLHGSIGTSCAVAHMEGDNLTVWSHGQGMFPLRQAIAEMLGMPQERVRCVHAEGSGCYGHNGADDAAADAALIARAFPGRPVRVQWMREQEHAWEPYGSAMEVRMTAGLGADGGVVTWGHEVWSHPHSTRPGGAGALMPAWHLERPFQPKVPKPIPQPAGGGDRNSIPLYAFPAVRVVHHFVTEMPVRVSAMRGLGAYANVFAIESFVDELAQAAGADPVAYRLRHAQDPRARDVIAAAAKGFGWGDGRRLPAGHGRGFAFARYKNLAAYCAVAAEVEVERESGRVRVVRVQAAVDSGQAVNPDGIRNQIGGGILQSLSWTLYEAVTFDDTHVTSLDWSGYPILRFPAVPDRVDVQVIDRPGQPFLGTGEASQGPTSAAIANAIAAATGVRLRDLPLTRERVKAAVGV